MIAKNFAGVKERVKIAAEKSGRKFSDIKIVGVAKTFSAENVNEAIKAGLEIVAENKIQEAGEKFPKLLPCEKHFVGHLQGNKAKKAAVLFDFVQSIDSGKIAEKLSDACIETGKIMPVLVQVRTDEEKNFGVGMENAKNFIDEISSLEGVKVHGLMTVPPICEEKKLREIYSQMRRLFNNLGNGNSYEMRFLSMGMSDDFEIAIEEGSNMVRIGRGIFGERKA